MNQVQIESINYNPQEYLEVTLAQPIATKEHVFYISHPNLLNCFIHLSHPTFLYFDTKSYISLKHYITHHVITKNDLKEWCLFILDLVEQEADGYYLCQLDYIFIEEKSKKMMMCKIPQVASFDYQVFTDLLLSIYECMNYEDDEEWISQMYLLLKQKPFRVGLFKQFLTSKKNRRWISFFKREEDEVSQFFKMIQVKESEPVYGGSTVPFETQVLMAGYQLGYILDEKQQKILISQTPFLIGRNKDCHLVLDYPEVSKQHCTITFNNGVCQIEDNKSTNGTVVNEEKLIANEKKELKDLDVILIAGHRFTYYV